MPERLRVVSARDREYRRQVGANVRRLRVARGHTIRWLADEVGASDATVTRVEQGKQVITTDLLDRIARALDTTAAHLARGSRASAAG